MDSQVMSEYLRITGGYLPEAYPGAEEQGKRIVKCTLLKEEDLYYSNSTPNVSKAKER